MKYTPEDMSDEELVDNAVGYAIEMLADYQKYTRSRTVYEQYLNAVLKRGLGSKLIEEVVNGI